MIVRLIVVLNRTAVDSYGHFDNLCGSHLQSQNELYTSVDGMKLYIGLISQLLNSGSGDETHLSLINSLAFSVLCSKNNSKMSFRCNANHLP